MTINLQRLEIISRTIEERINDYDERAFGELRDLLQRVQQSLDGGVGAADSFNRRTIALSTAIKQAEIIWERHQEPKKPTISQHTEMVNFLLKSFYAHTQICFL